MEPAIVILNWNAADETIRCVRTITTWEHLDPTVWVVDNHSTDGGTRAISREFPGIHLIFNAENLGFGGGNNQGIAQALSAGDVPILLLNNDASIAEDDVIRLLTTLHTDERLGFVGPLLFDTNQQGKLLSAGGRDIARHGTTHICQLDAGEPVRETSYVPGTVVLIHPQVFRTVGLFDAAYFFSGEMADLCERAGQQGYVSAIDTRARAYHAQHDPSNLRETLYAYYGLRNRFLFIRKFRRNRRFLLSSLWALYGLAMGLKAGLQGKSTKARALYLAVLDGMHSRFGGQNDRVLAAAAGQHTRDA